MVHEHVDKVQKHVTMYPQHASPSHIGWMRPGAGGPAEDQARHGMAWYARMEWVCVVMDGSWISHTRLSQPTNCSWYLFLPGLELVLKLELELELGGLDRLETVTDDFRTR